MNKKVWLVGAGDYDSCLHGAIFTDRQKAEEAKIAAQKFIDETNGGYDAFVKEIDIDPEFIGGWRYWIIEGSSDDVSYWIDDDPKKDGRYPSYSMVGNNNEEVGACGLGYTREEAHQNALNHVKQIGIRKLGLSINGN